MRKNELEQSRRGYLAAFLLAAAFAFAFGPSGLSFAKGDDPATECLADVQSEDGETCEDCDASCDNDSDVSTANGQCTFKVRACVNQVVAGCTAKTLKKVKVKPNKLGISVTPSGTSSVCGAFTNVLVKLKKKGKKDGLVKVNMMAKADGKPAMLDKDKKTYTCKVHPAGTPCKTTSTTTSSTSSTTTTLPPPTACTLAPGGTCCAAEQIQLTSSAGILKVDGLPPFPFPTGVTTTMNAGPPDAGCKHPVVVPAGGFFVPNFDIPALNYCSSVTPTGCESGGGFGSGFLWDGLAPTGSALTNITKSVDTSDGVCNPGGQACNTGPGGAGNNTQGDIDSVASVSSSGGVRSAIDIKVHSLTWSDSVCSPATTAGCCTGSNYNPGDGDLLITEFDFILSPTTDLARAQFADKNADGCKRAGSGFGPPTCNNSDCTGNTTPCPCCTGAGTGACPVISDPDPNGPDGPAQLTGIPAAGAGCVVGQATTVVSVGAGLSGGGPLYDLGFKSRIPNTVTACNPYPVAPGACTLTTDPCLQ